MPMQSQHFSSPQTRSGRHFLNSCRAFAAVYTDIIHPGCWKFSQRLVPSIHKPSRYIFTLLCYRNRNGSVSAKPGGRRSCLAGSRSPQALFYTILPVHGISVIKSRCSLTTDIVISSFYCMYIYTCSTHGSRNRGGQGAGPRPQNILTGGLARPWKRECAQQLVGSTVRYYLPAKDLCLYRNKYTQ